MVESAKPNRKLGEPGVGVGWKPRIFDRKARGKHTARRLVKCGCCDEQVEIHHDEYGLEINGVFASHEEWRRILLPLLHADKSYTK